MQFDWWTFALQLVNFAILAWLLQRFLYRPIVALIDRRRREVEAAFDEAEKTKREADDARRGFEQRSHELETERLRVLDDAHAEALEDQERVADAGRQRINTMEREAADRLERERKDALRSLRESSVDLAASLANRLLSAVASVSLCEAFLEHAERHLAALPEEERADLVGGDPAVTIAVAPGLDPPVREKWAGRLRRYLGDDVQMDFLVDTALIAGVELRLPRARLRFSLSDTLDRVRKELSPHAGPEDRRRSLAS